MLISAIRRRLGKNEQFLLWWAIVPFVFFSLSGSKLPGYILPMGPPIAFLCAKELLQPVSRLYRIGVFIEAGLFAFIGVAFGFFGNTLNVDPHVSGMLILTVTLVMAGALMPHGSVARSAVAGRIQLRCDHQPRGHGHNDGFPAV